MNKKIYLSPPNVGDDEKKFLEKSFDSNWIAPVGPDLDIFEKEIADYAANMGFACALSSGTAALHLALRNCWYKERGYCFMSNPNFCCNCECDKI